jgi:hypothetical protein
MFHLLERVGPVQAEALSRKSENRHPHCLCLTHDTVARDSYCSFVQSCIPRRRVPVCRTSKGVRCLLWCGDAVPGGAMTGRRVPAQARKVSAIPRCHSFAGPGSTNSRKFECSAIRRAAQPLRAIKSSSPSRVRKLTGLHWPCIGTPKQYAILSIPGRLTELRCVSSSRPAGPLVLE